MTSVQHITGQELDVKAASDTNSRDIVEQELEELRSKVDELSEEVDPLTFWGEYLMEEIYRKPNYATKSTKKLPRLTH